MSGGVEVQLPGPLYGGDHNRRRPQLLYTSRRRRTASSQTPQIRIVSPQELESSISHHPPLILDCRPPLSFGRGHITSAISVRCSDRLSRRRLKNGSLPLLLNDGGRRRLTAGAEVVLYDECTSDVGQLDDEHPLSAVVEAVREMGARPALLRGGWREFSKISSCLSIPPPFHPSSCPPEDPSAPFPSPLLPLLWVGGEADAADETTLRRLGVGYVLNVTSHVPKFVGEEFKFLRIPACDSHEQNLKQYFNAACRFIDEGRSRGVGVLVHCQAGVSRSATIAIAYLMRHERISSQEAYSRLKNRRPRVAPNLHFMGQLLEYEQQLNTQYNT